MASHPAQPRSGYVSIQKKVKQAVTATLVPTILLVAGVAAYGYRIPLDSGASTPPVREPGLLPTEPESTALKHRDPIRQALERLSEHELKLFYARCSRQSIARHLDGSEAMACSIGYDILLNKYFDGDFQILLAWSSVQAGHSPD